MAWRTKIASWLAAKGPNESLTLWFQGRDEGRVEAIQFNGDLRVPVSPDVLARLDKVNLAALEAVMPTSEFDYCSNAIASVRANAGKTVSLNRITSGVLGPLFLPNRKAQRYNAYEEFRVALAEVLPLLSAEEQARAASYGDQLRLNELGRVLYPDEGEKAGAAPLSTAPEASDADEEERIWERRRNVIFFGPPGTGKSHGIKDLVEKHLRAAPEHVIRVTFHPEYGHADFVGSFRPAVGWLRTGVPFVDADRATGDEEPRTYYRFEPGPFSRALQLASRNADKPVVLIIEEINRGNCAAIFGDVFQLLDRDDEADGPGAGASVYPIEPASEWREWLSRNTGQGAFDPARGLVIPGNLYLLATMNTSDQNLFPVDTAFRRRWGMEYVGVNDGWDFPVDLHRNDTTGVKWSVLRRALNKLIVEHTRTDDKQMGGYFLRPNRATGRADLLEFASKILFYLWSDVFRDAPSIVFHQDAKTYEQLVQRYTSGHGTFSKAVLDACHVTAAPAAEADAASAA